VWLRFRGGKGVATFLGTLLALHWPLGLACCATWVAVALVGRISSLAALVTAASTTFWMAYMGQGRMIVLGAALTVMVFLRHRANIARLRAGTEPKIGRRQ
jgi:glycerol-3-phosphate acyltransferase PlsY